MIWRSLWPGVIVIPANHAHRLGKIFKNGKMGKLMDPLNREELSILIKTFTESLPYIRDQLGHHSIKVTVDIYGHLAPEGNKAAVDGLDDPDFDAKKRNLYATKKKKDPEQKP